MKNLVKYLNNYIEHSRKELEIKKSSNFVLHIVNNNTNGFSGIKIAKATLIYIFNDSNIELFSIENAYSPNGEDEAWKNIESQFAEKIFHLFEYGLIDEIIKGTYGVE